MPPAPPLPARGTIRAALSAVLRSVSGELADAPRKRAKQSAAVLDAAAAAASAAAATTATTATTGKSDGGLTTSATKCVPYFIVVEAGLVTDVTPCLTRDYARASRRRLCCARRAA